MKEQLLKDTTLGCKSVPTKQRIIISRHIK